MAYYILQGGSSLQIMDSAGVLTTLTLPTGVTVDSGKRLRGTTLGEYTVLVNSTSENISVDRFGTTRVLCPKAPVSPVVLTATGSGTLSGTFRVKLTFIMKDLLGNLVAESEFSPVSLPSPTLANQFLLASLIPVSSQDISSRRLYRTTTGPGTTYFPWVDIDGNILVAYQDDQADSLLSLVAAPTDLGSAPNFDLVAAWKDRLWGKSTAAPDVLYQSSVNKIYAYPTSRTILIPPVKSDIKGITGFLPRKDELGVGRATALFKITGTNEDNFTRVTMSEHIGVWASDSCAVIKDVGYWLGNPYGIYSWGPSGVKCISDPKVRGWFTTDTYFNRALFDQAYGFHDPLLDGYVLVLASAGNTVLDRWIFYHIPTDSWWGPHKTDEFSPTGGLALRDANDIEIPALFASDGKVYRPQSIFTDGAATPIDMDVTLNWLSGDSPDIQKYWAELAIISKIQPSGILTITPTVGGLDSTPGATILHDMTLGRQRLRRLGTGRLLQLRLQQATDATGVAVYGLEIPFSELGRR